MKFVYEKILGFSKGGLTQAREVISMEMCYIVPVKELLVPVLHLQICFGDDVLSHFLDIF